MYKIVLDRMQWAELWSLIDAFDAEDDEVRMLNHDIYTQLRKHPDGDPIEDLEPMEDDGKACEALHSVLDQADGRKVFVKNGVELNLSQDDIDVLRKHSS